MLIGSLATAKWPYNETSMNSSCLLSVSLLSACSFIMNVWRYSTSKNKSKSSISMYKYEQKRYSVSC